MTQTRVELAAQRYKQEDERIALLARIIMPDTPREERMRLYGLPTDELRFLVESEELHQIVANMHQK